MSVDEGGGVGIGHGEEWRGRGGGEERREAETARRDHVGEHRILRAPRDNVNREDIDQCGRAGLAVE